MDDHERHTGETELNTGVVEHELEEAESMTFQEVVEAIAEVGTDQVTEQHTYLPLLKD